MKIKSKIKINELEYSEHYELIKIILLWELVWTSIVAIIIPGLLVVKSNMLSCIIMIIMYIFSFICAKLIVKNIKKEKVLFLIRREIRLSQVIGGVVTGGCIIIAIIGEGDFYKSLVYLIIIMGIYLLSDLVIDIYKLIELKKGINSCKRELK